MEIGLPSLNKISIMLIISGFFLIVIGYYERKKHIHHKKIVYKFIDQTIDEQHARQQEDVYNQYSTMFTDRSLGAS